MYNLELSGNASDEEARAKAPKAPQTIFGYFMGEIQAGAPRGKERPLVVERIEAPLVERLAHWGPRVWREECYWKKRGTLAPRDSAQRSIKCGE